jgi:hypothetical protein
MFAIRDERDYTVQEDFMKVRGVGQSCAHACGVCACVVCRVCVCVFVCVRVCVCVVCVCCAVAGLAAEHGALRACVRSCARRQRWGAARAARARRPCAR